MKGISEEESGLFHIPGKNKECEKCANLVKYGVCTGDEKHGWVDQTGEQKCFKPKEK